MKQFYEYGGRGDQKIDPDSIFHLRSDAGGVFLITKKIGKIEFILAYCRAAIIERWGCYLEHAMQELNFSARAHLRQGLVLCC